MILKIRCRFYTNFVYKKNSSPRSFLVINVHINKKYLPKYNYATPDLGTVTATSNCKLRQQGNHNITAYLNIDTKTSRVFTNKITVCIIGTI